MRKRKALRQARYYAAADPRQWADALRKGAVPADRAMALSPDEDIEDLGDY